MAVDVYYLVGDEPDDRPEYAPDWDEFTIFIVLDEPEPGVGDEAIGIRYGHGAIFTLSRENTWKEWPFDLPLRAYREFIRCVFEEY